MPQRADPVACAYARRLLGDLDIEAPAPAHSNQFGVQDRWHDSGLADLTGYPDTAVAQCPVPLANLADGALEALRWLAGDDILPGYTGGELLSLRARLSGLTRQGATSPGGSCHILPCADGHVAINLAREDDWQCLDALFLQPTAAQWPAVAERVASHTRMGRT